MKIQFNPITGNLDLIKGNPCVKLTTVNYTIGGENILFIDASSNAIDITLRTATEGYRQYIIKRIDDLWDNIVTINTSNNELIEDLSNYELDPFESITIQSDLTGWWIV